MKYLTLSTKDRQGWTGMKLAQSKERHLHPFWHESYLKAMPIYQTLQSTATILPKAQTMPSIPTNPSSIQENEKLRPFKQNRRKPIFKLQISIKKNLYFLLITHIWLLFLSLERGESWEQCSVTIYAYPNLLEKLNRGLTCLLMSWLSY